MNTPLSVLPDDSQDNVFSPALQIFALRSPPPDLRTTLRMTALMRATLFKHCAALAGEGNKMPAWLTGHRADGRPTSRNHLALFPLPEVASEGASGQILGLGLALPKGLPATLIQQWLGPVFYYGRDRSPYRHRLYDRKGPDIWLSLETDPQPPIPLQSSYWTQPAQSWVSVTPIALDRYPKGPDPWYAAEAIIAAACEHIGLPRPRVVIAGPGALPAGVPASSGFPAMQRKPKPAKAWHCHAVIIFDRPVPGPVLLGAGRYRGYGLCLPRRAATLPD